MELNVNDNWSQSIILSINTLDISSFHTGVIYLNYIMM
jgi:hypothetical protein